MIMHLQPAAAVEPVQVLAVRDEGPFLLLDVQHRQGELFVRALQQGHQDLVISELQLLALEAEESLLAVRVDVANAVALAQDRLDHVSV